MAIRDEVLVAAKEVFLRAYLHEFDRFLPKMMETAFKKSESGISLSQQSHYRILRRLLHDRSNELRQKLHISMDKLLQRSLQTAYSTFRPSFDLTDKGGLSLIEPSAFEGELRLAAFTERFRNEAEEQLRDLNARIALLFGQDEVKEREVPFRPYLVSKSLAEAAEGMALPAEVSDIMMPLLAESYAGAIDAIYGAVNRSLMEHGVAADMPLRIKKSLNKMSVGEHINRGFNRAGISDVAAADSESMSIATAMMRQFLERGSQQPESVALSRPLAQALKERLQAPAGASIGKASDFGELMNVVFEQNRQLAELTEDANERMIIDIVAMLFEYIARDSLLSQTIRAQLGKLQFLVLKIVLNDDSFWFRKEHPVRALINRMASVSAPNNSGDFASHSMEAKIAEITETLLNAALEDVDSLLALFVRSQDELETFIEQDIRNRDDKLKKAAQALDNLRGRAMNLTRLTVQLTEILSGMALNDFLREFITETWAEAIELADSFEPARAERFRILVPNLIWSVAPKVDEYDRQTLSALLPAMIGTLREGMMSIAWPQSRQKELLGRLFDAHTGALRSNQLSSAPSLASLHRAFKPLIHQESPTQYMNAQAIDQAEKIVISTTLRRFDGELLSSADYPEWEETAVGSGMQHGGPSRFEAYPEPRRHRGSFFEIDFDRTADRARLCWTSSDTSILLFKSDRQSAPLMLTLSEWQRMIGSGQMRHAESQLLFDRAIRSVLHTAEGFDRPD